MEKYHFIAIGGIGMSGLAKYLLENGYEVSGSDIEDSKYARILKNMGAKIYIGHNENNVPDGAKVIVSTAIKEDNPELLKAKELGLSIYHRSDLLKEIAEKSQADKKCFIGFAGTHGKTTTSGLASFVLEKSGHSPSFVVGGIVPELDTNAKYAGGGFFVAELDESDGTLIKYHPDILVINNLEEDHLDFYKNGMDDIIKIFNQAILQSKKVLVNADDLGIKKLSGNFITYGLADADYQAVNIITSQDGSLFDINYKGEYLTTIYIQIPGVHNIYNALAVASAMNEAGLTVDCKKHLFAEFTGMGRRFQKIYKNENITVYDDYAHHPTEIKATLNAAALKYGKEHVVAVFQPHRYTRLKGLWEEFQSSFDDAQRIIVTDIFSASEAPIDGISSEAFVSQSEKMEHISGNMEEVAEKLYSSLKQGDVVVGLGAGTITDLGKYLKKQGEKGLANRV